MASHTDINRPFGSTRYHAVRGFALCAASSGASHMSLALSRSSLSRTVCSRAQALEQRCERRPRVLVPRGSLLGDDLCVERLMSWSTWSLLEPFVVRELFDCSSPRSKEERASCQPCLLPDRPVGLDRSDLCCHFGDRSLGAAALPHGFRPEPSAKAHCCSALYTDGRANNRVSVPMLHTMSPITNAMRSVGCRRACRFSRGCLGMPTLPAEYSYFRDFKCICKETEPGASISSLTYITRTSEVKQKVGTRLRTHPRESSQC